MPALESWVSRQVVFGEKKKGVAKLSGYGAVHLYIDGQGPYLYIKLDSGDQVLMSSANAQGTQVLCEDIQKRLEKERKGAWRHALFLIKAFGTPNAGILNRKGEWVWKSKASSLTWMGRFSIPCRSGIMWAGIFWSGMVGSHPVTSTTRSNA
ncbi:hypothetical protein F1912_13820 [Akkermansia muciniphila]|nr:hypothetical protein F1912_13820 [Akkermansia muciniphila]